MPGARVLLNGKPEMTTAVGAALRAAGAEPVLVDMGFSQTEGGPFAAYVQLPVSVEASGTSVVERVERFLTDGLLARFRTANRVLPALGDNSRIVLVAGNTPSAGEAPEVPDDQQAREALLRVLRHAIRADLSPRTAWVSLLGGDASADTIAAAALSEVDPEGGGPSGSVEDRGRGYDDWRVEMLGMVGLDF